MPWRRAGDDARDDHPFDDQMRRVAHDVAVLDRARLALVGVADDVLLAAGRVADRLPLHAGRKAGAAQAAQSARLERRDDAVAIARRNQALRRRYRTRRSLTSYGSIATPGAGETSAAAAMPAVERVRDEPVRIGGRHAVENRVVHDHGRRRSQRPRHETCRTLTILWPDVAGERASRPCSSVCRRSGGSSCRRRRALRRAPAAAR